MTKADFISAVNEKVDGQSKKETGEFIDAVFETLQDAIKDDDRFTYPGFGTFKVKERAARQGRNPKTGQTIQIAASKTVGFKPSSKFKESL
ncbi:MAG: HU family DNA-binding protein [Myxococcota bacterium]